MLNVILNIILWVAILALIVFWVIVTINDKPNDGTYEDLDEDFDCKTCPFPCEKHKKENTALNK